MARLIPAPFRDLVTRLYREPARQNTLFELPRPQWHLPSPGDLDLSVDYFGNRAGNPSGVGGRRTQLAQNMLLSYVAGARVIELSRESPVTDAVGENVAGSMLIELFRESLELSGQQLAGVAGAVICDVRVDPDPASIGSDEVREFLEQMRAAAPIVELLRAEIPREFAVAREHQYRERVVDSVTLSMSPACLVEEIERSCELLIAEHDLDVRIELTPRLLGAERLEHLLRDVLGGDELRVEPQACESMVSLDEAVELCRRLTQFAEQHGHHLGLTFDGALAVRGPGDHAAPAGKKTQAFPWLSYMLALTLADEVRSKVGPRVPAALRAGVDQADFPLAVACGFVPVAAGTDWPRSAGYGRFGERLEALSCEMQEVGAVNIDELILLKFGQEKRAQRRATAELGDRADAEELYQAAVGWAGLLNASIVARMARKEPRRRSAEDEEVPAPCSPRPDALPEQVTDERVAACPNAANFVFPAPVVSFDYHDIVVAPDASWREGAQHKFEIEKERQLACYADFCDECADCETRAAEDDQPTDDKPRIFGSVEAWQDAAPRDGFVMHEQPEGGWIKARLGGAVYQLNYVNQTQQYVFDDGVVEARLSGWDHQVIDLRLRRTLDAEHRCDMGVYHALRYLRGGVLDPQRVNPVNVRQMSQTRYASGVPRC